MALTRSFARSAALTALLALAAMPAQANMLIDRSIVVFKPGDAPRQDILVTNAGKEPLYVQVEVLEVQNPGTPKEKRVVVTDPEKITLLATPRRFMVEPEGRRSLRIVNQQPKAADERVYRINLSPVVGKLEMEGESNAMAVKVVVGYQLLVLTSPAEPREGLEVKRSGKSAVFRNTGNTNILLFSGQQCPSAQAAEADCQQLPDHRLYPGNEWTLELPFDQAFDYQLTTLEKNQKRRFE
jgi:P pilus assembly chaperone PapD